MKRPRDKQGRLLMRNEVTLQIETNGKNYPLIIRPTQEIDPHDGEIVEIECQGAGIGPQDYLREDLPWLIDDIREMITDHQERIKKKIINGRRTSDT